MPFVPVPDTIELEVRMRLDGQRIENTLYVRRIGGFSIAQAVSVVNETLLWWQTNFRMPLSQDLTLAEVKVTDLSSVSGFAFVVPAPVPAPVGGVAAESMSSNVAYAVSFKTLQRGRSFSGRNFVPGLPISAVLLNTVDATTQSAILAAYNNFLTRMTALGDEWVVVSRFTANAPRAIGVATSVAAVSFFDNIVDSQRRRLPGRGR